MFTEEEKKILARHKYVPVDEIYHLTNTPNSIIKANVLHIRAGGMLSLTANPNLRYVIPERDSRNFRLILNFVKLKRDFVIFPVFYYSMKEFYELEPPRWLVSYYKRKGVAKYVYDLTYWNGASIIYLGKDLFSKESEWKSLRSIYPLKNYLLRTEKVKGHWLFSDLEKG